MGVPRRRLRIRTAVLVRAVAAAAAALAVPAIVLTASPASAALPSAAAARSSDGTSASPPPGPARGAAGTSGRTIVTFAWGGGNASQMQGLPLFRQYGMHATYYIPSGLVCFPGRTVNCGTSQYLTLRDIRRIAADGNEIGGLTVSHTHLTALPSAEAKRQICDDRVNLTRWGFTVTDFAYPYAVDSSRAAALARQCGYNSGLGAGQVAGAGTCGQCGLYAETIPPRDPMVIRAPVEVNASKYRWTAATFESIVRAAQAHGGGWIVFLIHDICPGYCAYGVTRPELRHVLSWVHEQAGPSLRVETVRQVIGGPVRRAVPGPAPAPAGGTGVANAALSTEAPNGYPACFQPADYGANAARFSYRGGGAPGGGAAETVSMTNWRSGDAKLLMETDLGECAPPVTPGRAYALGASYKSSRPVQFDVYYRNRIGAWLYWASSPRIAATATWAKARWTTPPVPSGATAISFGLALGSPGRVSTTGYSLAPASPDLVKPIALVLAALAVAAPFLGRRFWRYRSGGAGPDTAPGGEPVPPRAGTGKGRRPRRRVLRSHPLPRRIAGRLPLRMR